MLNCLCALITACVPSPAPNSRLSLQHLSPVSGTWKELGVFIWRITRYGRDIKSEEQSAPGGSWEEDEEAAGKDDQHIT